MEEAETAAEGGEEEVGGVEEAEGGPAVEETTAEPAEVLEGGEGDGEWARDAEGFFGFEEMQFKSGQLTGGTEAVLDGGPVDLVGRKMLGETEQVVEGAEGRPDALVVSVADLGMKNEMSY